MSSLNFTSTLPASFHGDLENLIFFNGQQWRARGAIVESLERYGEPRIISSEGALRVDIARREDAQCLFALTEEGDIGELAGIIIYLRTDIETLHVVYLAVAEEFSGNDNGDDPPLVLSLVQEMRRIARRLHGIRRVTMMSPEGSCFHITIRPEIAKSSVRRAAMP
jgi:hypothetical protein